MFCGVCWIGVEDVFDVSLAVFEVQGLDIWHRSKQADDGFISFDVGHGFLGIRGMRMDAELLIDEAFDASLETVFETVFAGGDAIINRTASEILVGKNQCVHFGMYSKIIFHRTFAEGHLGFVGALKHTVIAK